MQTGENSSMAARTHSVCICSKIQLYDVIKTFHKWESGRASHLVYKFDKEIANKHNSFV